MPENSTLLRALQRFAQAARKINPNPRQTLTIQDTPSILVSLPEHKPLLPLLLSHNIPSKLAKAFSDKYDGYVNQLKSKTESRLVPYLAYREKCHPFQAYSLFCNHYTQTLQRWSQSILNTALMSLKRDSVELENLEVTYPTPLWLPLPPDRGFSSNRSDYNSPLSPLTRPTHAFPTTYPPPLRPPPGVSPVEWPRTPETLPTPSTCTSDIDSLCNRFATSLVIDESPRQSQQSKPSIFSLPGGTSDGLGVCRSYSKLPRKKRPLRAQEPPTPPATRSGASSSQTAKPRRHSAPPFPPSSTRTKANLRGTSAPGVFSPQRTPEPVQFRDPTAQTSPPDFATTDASDTYFYPLSSTFLEQQPPLSTTLDKTNYTPRDPSHTPTGPTTPPTFLPDLFSEPIVVPSTPIHLSPRSSLMPIADPFLQFEPQYEHFSDYSLGSTFTYNTPTFGLPTSDIFSKSTFDMPLGFDHFFHGIPKPTKPDPLENTLFNTYTML